MNRIRIRSYGRALAASAVVVLVALGVAQAASTTSSIGSDYMENAKPTGCSTKNFCDLIFAVVPVGTARVITSVSCSLKFDNPNAQIFDAMLGNGPIGISGPYTALVPVVNATFASTRYFKINNAAYHVFRPGQTPHIFVRVSGATFVDVNCSISGVNKQLVS